MSKWVRQPRNFSPLPFLSFGCSTHSPHFTAKSILDRGLPPMKNRPSGSESTTSIPAEKDHPKATLHESKATCLIGDIHQHLVKDDTFAIWNTLKGKAELDYGSEDQVRGHVNLVLLDVAASLKSVLGDDFQVGFYSELSTFGDFGDLWVVRANGMAVGVVEVKKPGHQALVHENIIGECFDYMQDVRGFEGLDNVFCILTTYNQWRVLWLTD